MTRTHLTDKSNTIKPCVLFFAEAVTLAHMARPVVLAGALDPSIYDIHLAADPRYNHLFSNLPRRTTDIYSIPSQQFLTALARGSPIYSAKTLNKYVQDDLRLINDIQPDLVVGDFRLSLAISARLAKTPYVTITNAYWSPYARVRYRLPDHPIVSLVGASVAQCLFNVIRPTVFACHTLPINRVRRKYGLPPLGFDLRKVYTVADHVLYTDIPELIPVTNAPGQHHYIGPVLWSPQIERPRWWHELPDDKPIIYVTLGSSGKKDVLPTILDGLSDLPVSVVAATAGRINIHKCPKNAFVADYLPGNEAAERANLVICNGGSPTTHQALVAGTPVLGIPSNLDQYLNMDGILRAGVGRLLRSGSLTARSVGRVVQDLLSSSHYCQASDRIGRCLLKYDALTRFRDLMGQVLRHESSS